MSDDKLTLRSIAWIEVFPFLRLFSTFRGAIDPARLALALACVVALYCTGRLLDALWGKAGAVKYQVGTSTVELVTLNVPLERDPTDDVEAFVLLPPRTLAEWRTKVAEPNSGYDARGPFMALIHYESRCFAAAVRGAAAGRWGFGGDAFAPEPSLLGSVRSAGSGVIWLVTERPWYALLFGVLLVLIVTFFGGAIARHAAVQLARDITISSGQALRFACDKYASFAGAPLGLAALILVLGLSIVLGGIVVGLISLIPVLGGLGYILGGLLFIIPLVAGLGAALMIIATVAGGHLITPTIAVEGSDYFDGVSNAWSYLVARPWSVAFYGFVTLIYGGLCFVFVRLAALVVLKVTHGFAGAGMSLFGRWHSVNSEWTSRLDALWQMPAWSELTLLPAVSGPAFWGTFGNAELSWGEQIAMWLIALWVFLIVALVGAFVLSFYFTASTQMYLLLRREVDGNDFSDIFYEDDDSSLAAEIGAPAQSAPASAGTPLTVMGGAPKNSE